MDDTLLRLAWKGLVTEFYERNPELRPQSWLVQVVWARHFRELSPLSVTEGMRRLAVLCWQAPEFNRWASAMEPKATCSVFERRNFNE